jgi:hypothetical protein
MVKALNRPRSLAACVDAGATAAWVIVAVIVFAIAADICYVGGISAPFLDLWRYTNPDTYLQHLFERHNGHPLLINRLALALDYTLFDGAGDAVRFATLALKAGEACAFVALARMAGVTSRRDLIIAAAAAAVIAFCAAPHINLRQQFQFSFVAAFAATAGAVAALVAYAEDKRLWRFVLAVALCAIAAQSLLNGLLTPLLALALAARFKLPLTHLAALAAVFALSLLSIVLNPSRMSDLAPLDVTLIANLLKIVGSAPAILLDFACRQFDVSIAFSSQIAMLFGALMALASAPTLWRVLRNRASLAETGAAALILFGAASAGMMALGRSTGVENAAVVSRYTEASIIVLGGLLAIGAGALIQLKPALQRACLLLALPIAFIMAIGGVGVLMADQSVQRTRLTAQTAQIVQIDERRAIAALGGPGVARRYFGPASADLKAHGKMHFADRWARAMGETIAFEADAERPCRGRVALRASPFDGFVRLQGRVDAREVSAGRSIVVLDRARRMIGYGRTPRRWDDLLIPLIQRPPLDIVGYARREDDAFGYAAYLANQSGLLCRFEVRGDPSLRTD